MQLVNYHQSCLNCTMLGVVRAAADYYGLNASTPALYGASGHAFLMNIHKELCPSGPYCWTMEPFLAQLAAIGLVMTDLGFFGSDSTPAQRAVVEAQLKRALDAGVPCSLLNMENQCISGYDETGFITAQPWPGLDFPPAHLSFGSWSEVGGEAHISYFTLTACPPAPTHEAIRAGLRYARDLYAHPERHSGGDYAVGAGAWTNWSAALRSGKFNPHGNWWNAMVWSECRAMAAAWLNELAGSYPAQASLLHETAADYTALSDALMKVGDNNAPIDQRLELLADASQREAHCITRLAELEQEF